MQERIDALTAAGAQNVWPKFIFQRRNKESGDIEHVLVAEVVDEQCYLTEEGKALLEKKPEDIVDAEIVSETPKRRKKASEPVIDLGLDLDNLDV